MYTVQKNQCRAESGVKIVCGGKGVGAGNAAGEGSIYLIKHMLLQWQVLYLKRALVEDYMQQRETEADEDHVLIGRHSKLRPV